MTVPSPRRPSDGPLAHDNESIAATAKPELKRRRNGHHPVIENPVIHKLVSDKSPAAVAEENSVSDNPVSDNPVSDNPPVAVAEENPDPEARTGGRLLGRLAALLSGSGAQKQPAENLPDLGQKVIGAAYAAERKARHLKTMAAEQELQQKLSEESAVGPTTAGPSDGVRTLNPSLPAISPRRVGVIQLIVVVFEAGIWFQAFSTSIDWRHPDPVEILTAAAIAAGLTTASLIVAHGWGAAVQRLLRHRGTGQERASQIVTAAMMTGLFALLMVAYAGLAIWRFNALTLAHKEHPPTAAMAIAVIVLPLALGVIQAGLMSEHNQVARRHGSLAQGAQRRLGRAEEASSVELERWAKSWHALYGVAVARHRGLARLVDHDPTEGSAQTDDTLATAEDQLIDNGPPEAIAALRILREHHLKSTNPDHYTLVRRDPDAPSPAVNEPAAEVDDALVEGIDSTQAGDAPEVGGWPAPSAPDPVGNGDQAWTRPDSSPRNPFAPGDAATVPGERDGDGGELSDPGASGQAPPPRRPLGDDRSPNGDEDPRDGQVPDVDTARMTTESTPPDRQAQEPLSEGGADEPAGGDQARSGVGPLPHVVSLDEVRARAEAEGRARGLAEAKRSHDEQLHEALAEAARVSEERFEAIHVSAWAAGHNEGLAEANRDYEEERERLHQETEDKLAAAQRRIAELLALIERLLHGLHEVIESAT